MIKIKINTGNAAFDDDRNYEIAMILKKISEDIACNWRTTSYNDTNGNPVCTVEYTGKDR